MNEVIEIQNNTEINRSISNYSRMGIDIEIIETSTDTIKVKITQRRLLNGYILNQKQLIQRAKEVFDKLEFKIIVIPNVFSLDVDSVSLDWINKQMLEYGINRKDIIKQLAIDKSSLSLLLSGERKMNKLVKSAFYFYFLTYEINKGFRE